MSLPVGRRADSDHAASSTGPEPVRAGSFAATTPVLGADGLVPPLVVAHPPGWLRLWHARRDLVLGLASVSILLVVWQLVVQVGFFNEFFASKPTAIVQAGYGLAVQGVLAPELGTTATGFLLGYGLAVLVGVPLGIVVGWYRTAFALFQPYIAALNATPRIALYPLFVVWFGIGLETKVVIVFIASLIPILFTTIGGVRSLDTGFVDVARCMGAKTRQVFTTVALPGSVPFIMTGLRLGVGHALLATIVAELFIGSRGIGALMNTYATYFQTARLMFLILLVAAAGVIILQVVQWVEQRVEFWRPAK